jgi:hypothetical protein
MPAGASAAAPPTVVAVTAVVQVYRNLNRPGRTYSVRDKRTGLVVDRSGSVALSNVVFRVQPGGQRRARSSGHRNVHAFAEGTPMSERPPVAEAQWRRATYNPFAHAGFVDCATGAVLTAAAMVVLDERGLFYLPDATEPRSAER